MPKDDDIGVALEESGRALSYKVKTETFSFISLAITCAMLLVNTVTNWIPTGTTKFDPSAGVMVQSSELSFTYVFFTVVMVALISLFLYMFLSKSRTWSDFKDWANSL